MVLETSMRTFTCGELRKKDIKKKVVLTGWVSSRRDHGGIIFIDLRDRYGITQIVFDPSFSKKSHQIAEKLGREDVIQIKGEVRYRGKGLENPKLKTGEIEVWVSEINLLNQAETPPLEIDDYKIAREEARLRYRYLDLRRPLAQSFLIKRHQAAQVIRQYLNQNNFLEIETPLLIKHTPEGARDFIVPSRLHPGKFYSLPQSPQLFKQLLMIAGFDRYYQLARCLRDEDAREDRQPEFTQIDLEMSFVNEEDIFKVSEGLIQRIWQEVKGKKIKIPFPKITYQEAMEKYGTDRPDLRFGLELKTVTKIFKDSNFGPFKETLAYQGVIKCLKIPFSLSRKQIEDYISLSQQWRAKGLIWLKLGKEVSGSLAKSISKKEIKELVKETGAKGEEIFFFIAGKEEEVNFAFWKIRLKLGEDLQLINREEEIFVWITDFPLLVWNEEENKWESVHHPFTSPREEDWPLLEKSPERVRSRAYDLVLNGTELGGGSIRINRLDGQEKILSFLGLDKEKAEEKFSFLLRALRYGAPPHGGIAFGFDRLIALLCGFNDLREVIAFPKTKSFESPMEGSPAFIDEKELKDLHIQLDEVAKRNIKSGSS